MGALHAGHFSLIKGSKSDCDFTVVSIFVNPAQFSPKEDFNSYPRNLEEDIVALKSLDVDVLFLPSNTDFYPADYSTYVEEVELSKTLEGLSRPHFFKGVVTVVLKLFNIIKPTSAYFGKKDVQQLKIIEKIVKDLNIDIDILGLDTIREKSGLAMSSRNFYFSNNRREELGSIYESLKYGKRESVSGNKNSESIKKIIMEKLLETDGIKIDYIDIGDFHSLKSLEKIDRKVIISLAVFVDGVRLIDNIDVDF